MKEKIGKKGIKRRLFRVILALMLVVSLVPIYNIPVYASTYDVSELSVGSVVNAGDVLSRGSSVVYFNFDDFYFGISSEDNSEHAHNNRDSWTLKDTLPPNVATGVEPPSWYFECSIFKVVDVDFNGYYDIYFKPAHTWTYQVNGETLTATCNKGCGAENPHTENLTITANDITYSGSPVTYGDADDSSNPDIKITGYEAWKTATGSYPNIAFVVNDSLTPTAPTDIGDYSIGVFPGSSPGTYISAEFSIESPIKVRKMDGDREVKATYGEDYEVESGVLTLKKDDLIVSAGDSNNLVPYKLCIGDGSNKVESATLKNLYLSSSIVIYGNAPVLNIQGENQIGTADERGGLPFVVESNSLNVIGEGDLTIYDSKDGINLLDGDLTFDTGFTGTLTIDEEAEDSEPQPPGCAINMREGSLTVNNGTLNLKSDKKNGITAGTININGGTVIAQGGDKAMSVAPTLGKCVKVETASTDFDGSSSEVYSSGDIETYKYLKVVTHSWSYKATGATLTATCDKKCGETSPHTASLTLSANNANYSGNAVEASISPAEKTAWEEAGLTVPDIKYFGREGTQNPANNAAPKEVGKYTAKITLDNIVFATKDFEIIDPNAGGKVTIHRYLRPDQKDWLITCNEKEIENLKAAGWKDEGALGFAGTKDTGVEVIRFYNEITGDRMYTSNEKEKQNYRDAKKYGWIEEGVAFYTGNKAKIVRYTTPTLSHLWSVSIEEQSRLDAHESEGWKKEGVAFYLN